METPNGAANTVGGRFIPSGLLLAQDFTHEPACQTGERAPQGRFRHQPEQMNFATLRTYSLEIKVQQALSVFLSVYPELVALVGARVPDYQGIFLRGTAPKRVPTTEP